MGDCVRLNNCAATPQPMYGPVTSRPPRRFPPGRCPRALRATGAGSVMPRLRAALVNELGDDDAGGRGAGGQRKRGGGQFGQVAAGDGERADGADLALVDV